MNETLDRELEAILELIKLTQDGNLQWETIEPWGDLFENETTKYASVFFCGYIDKRLRIFIERKRIDKPTGLNALASLAYSISTENKIYPYWTEKVVLEVTNQSGQSLWRFPYKSAISDLLTAVKYQVSGIKDILDSLLLNKVESRQKE
jgi:hypothetical protein